MRTPLTVILVGLLAVGFGACNRNDTSESDAHQACGSAPTEIATANLPAHFPNLDGVIYTQSAPQGPSTQVIGYARNSVAGLFKDLKEKFGNNPYAITKAEKDAHDAEVNFSSAADNVSGQVAISEECKGRLHVRVIVRPL